MQNTPPTHKDKQKPLYASHAAASLASPKAQMDDRLQALHSAFTIEDMDIPGWGLRPFKAARADLWSISAGGNWRIVFEFVKGRARRVNRKDYR